MDASKRRFFGSFAGIAAVPVAGAAKALGLAERSPRPEPVKPGGMMSSADFNARFDAVYKAIDAVR